MNKPKLTIEPDDLHDFTEFVDSVRREAPDLDASVSFLASKAILIFSQTATSNQREAFKKAGIAPKRLFNAFKEKSLKLGPNSSEQEFSDLEMRFETLRKLRSKQLKKPTKIANLKPELTAKPEEF